MSCEQTMNEPAPDAGARGAAEPGAGKSPDPSPRRRVRRRRDFLASGAFMGATGFGFGFGGFPIVVSADVRESGAGSAASRFDD